MPAEVLARHVSSRRRVALAISTPAGPTQAMWGGGGVTAWRGATPGPPIHPPYARSQVGRSNSVAVGTRAALRWHVTARINDARLTQDESHGPAGSNRRPRSRRAAHKGRRPSTVGGVREAKSRQELVAGVARTRPESEGGTGGCERAVAMAEQHKEESVLEKISDKLHGHGGGSSSSSSDSDDERSSATAAVKAKIYSLFGREKPVHSVLGGGKRKPGPQRSSPDPDLH
jgi:hypothetical protein